MPMPTLPYAVEAVSKKVLHVIDDRGAFALVVGQIERLSKRRYLGTLYTPEGGDAETTLATNEHDAAEQMWTLWTRSEVA